MTHWITFCADAVISIFAQEMEQMGTVILINGYSHHVPRDHCESYKFRFSTGPNTDAIMMVTYLFFHIIVIHRRAEWTAKRAQ